MTDHLLTEITVFILAVFVGIEVIGRVPSTLHTPLMSATNAIHGIVLVGAILVAGLSYAPLGPYVGFILIVLASLNVFGGYTVTERMLAMFRPRPVVTKKDDYVEVARNPRRGTTSRIHHGDLVHPRPEIYEFAEDRALRNRLDGRHGHRADDVRAGVAQCRSSSAAWSSVPPSAYFGGRQDDGDAAMVAIFNGCGGGAASLVRWAN